MKRPAIWLGPMQRTQKCLQSVKSHVGIGRREDRQIVGLIAECRSCKGLCRPYPLIRGRLVPGPETEQGLERGLGLPAPIVAKD